MRVEFEFNQDDLIDVWKRVLARSKVVRSWEWQGLLYTAVVVWVLSFLFFYKTPITGAIVGLVTALISALIYPSLYRSGVKRRMRSLAREKFGAAKTFLCEVELREDGIFVRQMNTQMVFEWENVEEIKETSDSVDVFTRDGAGVIVRGRAFDSPAERIRFIELAQAHVSAARS